MQVCVIGEDALTCALGERLVLDAGLTLSMSPINTGGVTKLRSSVKRYASMAKLGPVLCIADTDGACAVSMISDWFPHPPPAGFMLRFAVHEAESWLLADRQAFASFFKVPEARLPTHADQIKDPKRTILSLAPHSSKRLYRQEIVSDYDSSKPGFGYNVHLREFVLRSWRPSVAKAESPSLAKAVARLAEVVP